jgi:hypothetical protein
MWKKKIENSCVIEMNYSGRRQIRLHSDVLTAGLAETNKGRMPYQKIHSTNDGGENLIL